MSYEQEILRIIKRAAIEAVAAERPMQHLQGVVESTNPLKIRVNQKLLLSSAHILLTNAVRDHKIRLETASGTRSETYIVRNALSPGEAVLLLRCDGGQRYIVIDRLEAMHDATN